jgi:hypothetical protein
MDDRKGRSEVGQSAEDGQVIAAKRSRYSYLVWLLLGKWDAPIVPDIPDRKVIKTNTATISINDLSGVEGEGIRIETITSLKLIMNSRGIELNNGSSSIRLTPTNILINNHVLVV